MFGAKCGKCGAAFYSASLDALRFCASCREPMFCEADCDFERGRRDAATARAWRRYQLARRRQPMTPHLAPVREPAAAAQ